MKKILAVCLGNICRSPTAHGLLEIVAKERGIDVFVDSAGTAGYHIGNPPDSRSAAKMREHGHDISMLRARQFTVSDFDQFDIILAMDKSNLRNILSLARNDEDKAKVHLMLSFGNNETDEVPDPYYGEADGFEQVYQLIHHSVNALFDTF